MQSDGQIMNTIPEIEGILIWYRVFATYKARRRAAVSKQQSVLIKHEKIR